MDEEGKWHFQLGWFMVPFSLVASWIVPIHGSVIMIKSVLDKKVMGLSSSFRIACVIGLLLLMLVQKMFIPIDGGPESVLGGWRWDGEKV